MRMKQQAMRQTNRVFDTPFIVEEKRVSQDENGIEREEWCFKYKLYADGRNLHGSEYELARQVSNRKTVKFIVKAGPTITEHMRIQFNCKIYDIDNIDNIGFKNEEIEIKAIERRLDI